MTIQIVAVIVKDIRFPTSRPLHGSDVPIKVATEEHYQNRFTFKQVMQAKA